jgi:uncharacterized membrane protein
MLPYKLSEMLSTEERDRVESRLKSWASGQRCNSWHYKHAVGWPAVFACLFISFFLGNDDFHEPVLPILVVIIISLLMFIFFQRQIRRCESNKRAEEVNFAVEVLSERKQK